MSENARIIPNLSYFDAQYLIESQLSTANYLLPTEADADNNHRKFYDNVDMWGTIISEKIRCGAEVSLENFCLMEWFPRSPGLYFTDDGRSAREEAAQHKEEMDLNQSEPQYAIDAEGDKVTVYNPYGKAAMLRGGLGTLRLKPRLSGEHIEWFMCATANGVAHEGIPLLLADDIYAQCIDQIATQGAWRGTIRGKLRIVSERLVTLYDDYTGVPQLYLEVDKLIADKKSSVREPIKAAVSVAISFASAFEGPDQMYASYVFFDPARENSLERNTDWMQETYVEGTYHGKILTDFDEINSRFAEATFSLDKVMSGKLDTQAVRNSLDELGLPGDLEALFNRIAAASGKQIIINGDVKVDGNGNIVAIGGEVVKRQEIRRP